ncbi:MAG: hypothetical protein ABIH67_04380 [Candidatus Uhrbacteria bacterium]
MRIMVQSNLVLGIRYFFIDLIGGVLNFPIWWYTRGLNKAQRFCFGSIKDRWKDLAIGLWFKNLFVPMYGETAISGRLISLLARIAMLIGKGTAFIIWSLILIALLIIYLIALPVVAINIIYHARFFT